MVSKGLVFIFITLLLAGCAQSPSKLGQTNNNQTPTIQVITAVMDGTADNTQLPQGGFDDTTLYALLVAEFSELRGFPEVTLHHYLQEAKKTEDLGVIIHASEIADYLKDTNGYLEATLLWTKAEPDNSLPFSNATNTLIRQGRFEEAKPLLKRSLELKRFRVVDTLISHSGLMTAEERQSYLSLFNELLNTSPDNAQYLYAKASLLVHDRRYEEALILSQKALRSSPKHLRATLLEADLQDQLGHLDTAIAHLRQYLIFVNQKRYRNHKEFRLLYTRLLLKKAEFFEAEEQAKLITLKNRHDEGILHNLGVLMLHHNRLDASEHYFNLLADLTGVTGELQYYYGRIAQLRGQRQQALKYFAGADDPRYLVTSFNEISNILDQAEEQEQLSRIFTHARREYPNYAALLYGIESHWLAERELNSDALVLLNDALMHYPNDVRLLYNRAMVWGKKHEQAKMEADLRKFLQAQPTPAPALDILSYSLMDRSQPHHKTEKYHRLELHNQPNDPAILDSMGWVLHDSGDLDDALKYLKKAYDISPTTEIAAHLGAVYWKLGQHDLAMKIWGNSRQADPNHSLLNKFLAIAREGS